MPNDPTFLGTIQDVAGATISVAMGDTTLSGLVYVDGHGYRIGQVGSFVRVPIGYTDLFGIVSQVGAGALPERLSGTDSHGYRWMTVQLVGEGVLAGEFRRGLSQYPTIGDRVHLVTRQDLGRIYGHPDVPRFVRVGHLASAESVPALVNIDRLVTRHSAVVGSTGTGKSTTVAGLLASLSDGARYPSARILVLDVHGEYATALADRSTVFRIHPSRMEERPLFIPYWAMTVDELLPIAFASLADDAGRGAVTEKIMALKLANLKDLKINSVTPETLTADSPVPFSIHKMWFDRKRAVNPVLN